MPDWRPMLATDVAAVHELSKLVHPAHPESRAVLAEKRKLYQSGCFVLGPSDAIAGYAFAHPWPAGDVPKLDALIGKLPAESDALFVHDVALREEARGKGAVVELFRLFDYSARARGLASIALVAIAGMRAYWERAGFTETPVSGVQSSARDAYGEGAIAMVRDAAS